MAFTILNPYASKKMPWLRGNLHAHTTNSDGSCSPQETANAYAALGYDFIMVSDHDHFTDPDGIQTGKMVLIPGSEITHGGPHILHVNTREALEPAYRRQDVLDTVRGNGGFAIMCHPNWEEHFNHCPQETLEALDGYAGIEILNGVVTVAAGNALATDRWDQLLSKGRRVWGYAHDDCHAPEHFGLAWNMVQCARRDPASIVDALREGRCYASSGVVIDTIDTDETTITVRARNAQRVIAYSDHQKQVRAVDGDVLTIEVPDQPPYTYLRFECCGKGEQRAWTQPFFIEQA
jgi:PHP-associated